MCSQANNRPEVTCLYDRTHGHCLSANGKACPGLILDPKRTPISVEANVHSTTSDFGSVGRCPVAAK